MGGALGLAVLATLATTRSETLTRHGDTISQALTGGYRLAFAVGAGIVLVALALSAWILEPLPEPAPTDVEVEAALSEAS